MLCGRSGSEALSAQNAREHRQPGRKGISRDKEAIKIEHDNLNFYLQDLEIEKQFQLKRTEQEAVGADLSAGADAPGDMAEDTAENLSIGLERQTPLAGLILPGLQKPDGVLSEGERKIQRAGAESQYGVIPGATEPADDPESMIDYKA